MSPIGLGASYYVIVDAASVIRCPFKFIHYYDAKAHRDEIVREIPLFIAKAEETVSISLMRDELPRHYDYVGFKRGRTIRQIRERLTREVLQ